MDIEKAIITLPRILDFYTGCWMGEDQENNILIGIPI